jgi:hypothetical protein
MMLHRSTLTGFLTSKVQAGASADPKGYTLNDLVTTETWLSSESFTTIPPGSPASKAKEPMDRFPRCKDAFVTLDGTAKTKASRWITNIDLLKASEV